MSSAVPDGWFSKSLDEVSIFIRDGTHGTHERLNEGIPLLSAKNISSDGHITCDSTDSLISEVDYQKIHAKYAVEEDDLLLTVVGTLGRTALVPKGFRKFTLQRSVAVIRLDAKIIHPQLCYQYLRGDEFQRQLSLRSNSTAQAGVYLGELGKISIPIPPLPEQKKIASILTSVDEVIENTLKQIDKLQDLKKATMNELLTKGIGHTEFKDSELGQIPKSWEVLRMSSIAQVIDSLHETPTFSDFGIPMVRVTDIKRGDLTFDNAKTVSEEDYRKFTKKYEPQLGDIVMSRVGSYGVSSYVSSDKPFCMGQNTVIINAENISGRFLYECLESDCIQRQIELEVAGSGYKSLSLANIRSLAVPVPPMHEQEHIRDLLLSIDGQVTLQKQKLSQTQFLKKSLMQDLLTGKIRVTVN